MGNDKTEENSIFIRIYDSILSNPDIDVMGLEAFGAWVLLATHCQKYGYRGRFKFKSKSELQRIMRCKTARKSAAILYTLQHSICSSGSILNWIQVDIQTNTIFIPKWRKYQQILNHKKGSDWAGIGQDLARNVPYDSILDSTIREVTSFTNVKEVSAPKEKNSKPDYTKPPKLNDWIHHHCPILVDKFGSDVYAWAGRWIKAKPKDSTYIKATCLHFNRFPDILTKENLWGMLSSCINDRWAGMLATEKEINENHINSIFEQFEAMNAQA